MKLSGAVEKENKDILVFTYGTLKRGFRYYNMYLNGSIGKSEYLYDATTKGIMYDLGAYPAVNIDEDGIIHGEVFKIEPKVLAALDYLEGYPQFYNRSQVELSTGDKAWIYHIPRENIPSNKVIEDGKWTKKT